jgi:hypothetical protein
LVEHANRSLSNIADALSILEETVPRIVPVPIDACQA